jgi:hypothetical protein
MNDSAQSEQQNKQPSTNGSSNDHPDYTKGPVKQLVLGLIFGLAFGFLLQKGGVAKYHILMGVLLLEDFTVIKVMLSAIVVGMVGIFIMHAMGLVKLHIKPTRYGANILGGLLFGVGFALLGYCPGTGAAAFGQGNYDAVAGILGMMAGSYVFAEVSGRIEQTISQWGNRGELTLPELVHVPTRVFIPIAVPILAAVLLVLEWAV